MATNAKHKFAFIHIPKTGGVTIEKELSLENHDGHRRYIYYKNRYPDYDIHTIVRNPYDRYISAFTFMNKYNDKHPKNRRYEHYTKHGLYGCIKRLNDHGIYRLTPVLKNQYMLLQDEHGKIKCTVHKFEDFYDTYVEFCNLLDVEPKDNLPKHNTTKHLDYREYYRQDKKLQEEVYKYYKKDFELFGYSKEII